MYKTDQIRFKEGEKALRKRIMLIFQYKYYSGGSTRGIRGDPYSKDCDMP